MEPSDALPSAEDENAAGSTFSDWIDADTAMRWAGERLGVFGEGRVASDLVISTDSRLRRALFDVLLSMVEGGVADIRRSDNGYEFRARVDDEAAWLAPAGPALDLIAPPPWSGEFRRACDEREAALRRAEVAEAVAAERERLLQQCLAARNGTTSASDDGGERADAAFATTALATTRKEGKVESPRPISADTLQIVRKRTWLRIAVAVVLLTLCVFFALAAILYVTHRPPKFSFVPDALTRSHKREDATAAVTFVLAIAALATTWFVLRPGTHDDLVRR